MRAVDSLQAPCRQQLKRHVPEGAARERRARLQECRARHLLAHLNPSLQSRRRWVIQIHMSKRIIDQSS
ncbi:hypothetical protein JOB18_039236 [Solea senegalensis]|uniref:Uncharacterized protein n=1 Tax=Solea senegalensis TaxID=28829 RepID=A0AAV6SV26_SOLSE|nr:hypothetical protein JOB18_039236 [Solea senegalensis]